MIGFFNNAPGQKNVIVETGSIYLKNATNQLKTSFLTYILPIPDL